MTGPLYLLEEIHSNRIKAAGLYTQSAALEGPSLSDAPPNPRLWSLLPLAFARLPWLPEAGQDPVELQVTRLRRGPHPPSSSASTSSSAANWLWKSSSTPCNSQS